MQRLDSSLFEQQRESLPDYISEYAAEEFLDAIEIADIHDRLKSKFESFACSVLCFSELEKFWNALTAAHKKGVLYDFENGVNIYKWFAIILTKAYKYDDYVERRNRQELAKQVDTCLRNIQKEEELIVKTDSLPLIIRDFHPVLSKMDELYELIEKIKHRPKLIISAREEKVKVHYFSRLLYLFCRKYLNAPMHPYYSKITVLAFPDEELDWGDVKENTRKFFSNSAKDYSMEDYLKFLV